MVTGATRGIGLAVARQLKAEGYTLSLGVRKTQDIPEDLAGCDAHYYEAKDKQSAVDWVNHAKEKFHKIDGVIHVAGLLKLWDIEQADESVFDELMDVNAKGTYRLAQAVLPELKKTGDGRMIVFVSMAGKRIKNDKSYAKIIGYAASKHAQLALCKGIQIAGYDEGIRVCSICTSCVNTDMIKLISNGMSPEVMTQPEDLAKLTSHILSLPNNAVVEELLVNYR